jgi:hypothetical protein
VTDNEHSTHSAHEWIRTIAVLLTPAAAIAAVYFAALGTTKTGENRLVELAITILQAPPNDSTRQLRSWATEVIDRYSGVKFSDSLRRQLTDSIRLYTIHTGPWDVFTAETLRVPSKPGTVQVIECDSGGFICDTLVRRLFVPRPGRTSKP